MKASKNNDKGEVKRVSSGIENFDKLIEGGFEKDSTSLIVGNSGSGKTIFATQFLIEGIKKGEKCLYVTFEEKKAEFYNNMLDFCWNLEDYEKEGKLLFLEYTPEKVRTMLEEGGGEIESLVLDKKITRIVIDSLTSFELLFDDKLKKKESALSLFNMLKKWNCTTLLTYEEELFGKENTASKTLEFESDAIIVIYFVRVEKKRERFIEILKMRGTKHSREIYPLSIDEKKGIVVGNNPYLGKLENE